MRRHTPHKIFAIASVVLFSGCVKQEQPANTETVVVQNVTQNTQQVAREKPTVAEALEAIRRAHPHSIQSCYDSSMDGFLIEYSILPDGAPPDNFWHGWQFLKSDKLYKSANGTWFTQNRPENDYALIYPDPTGLPCKKT